uniref:Uncharacterized protein n=1 Tax=Anguilla anguilla TaxID=7936 RepID=A0A0E9QIP4_ANGAN
MKHYVQKLHALGIKSDHCKRTQERQDRW